MREEALQSARQLMSEGILSGRRPDSRCLVVTDDAGMIVAEIPLQRMGLDWRDAKRPKLGGLSNG